MAADQMRNLTVLADEMPVASGCRFYLSGKTSLGLFPSLFLLECRNLPETDVFRLRNTKELSVFRGNSCLASGKVTDVFRRTVPEGTVTTAAFSMGLDLWEARISLSVPAGSSVSETVWQLLQASGTGIPLLSFPGEDPVFIRGQAFCGRAAECVESVLTAASARGYLVPAGMCIAPERPLPPTLCLTEADLKDAPMPACGGKKMILSTTVTGFQPGEEMTLSYRGTEYSGLILERMVDADTSAGPWSTQLLMELRLSIHNS